MTNLLDRLLDAKSISSVHTVKKKKKNLVPDTYNVTGEGKQTSMKDIWLTSRKNIFEKVIMNTELLVAENGGPQFRCKQNSISLF